jgi:hypothetical protein
MEKWFKVRIKKKLSSIKKIKIKKI